jgi:hypothetical protein
MVCRDVAPFPFVERKETRWIDPIRALLKGRKRQPDHVRRNSDTYVGRKRNEQCSIAYRNADVLNHARRHHPDHRRIVVIKKLVIH